MPLGPWSRHGKLRLLNGEKAGEDRTTSDRGQARGGYFPHAVPAEYIVILFTFRPSARQHYRLRRNPTTDRNRRGDDSVCFICP